MIESSLVYFHIGISNLAKHIQNKKRKVKLARNLFTLLVFSFLFLMDLTKSSFDLFLFYFCYCTSHDATTAAAAADDDDDDDCRHSYIYYNCILIHLIIWASLAELNY
jgi:hypothetical protein